MLNYFFLSFISSLASFSKIWLINQSIYVAWIVWSTYMIVTTEIIKGMRNWSYVISLDHLLLFTAASPSRNILQRYIYKKDN